MMAQQNRDKHHDFSYQEDIENRRTIFRNLTYYLELLVSKDRPNMCYRSPCGAGNCIISFNTNGDIYPCEEMVVHDLYKIGNVYDRRNITTTILESESNQKLNSRLVENLAGCRSCPWRRFCAGGCPARGVCLENSGKPGARHRQFSHGAPGEAPRGLFLLEALRGIRHRCMKNRRETGETDS